MASKLIWRFVFFVIGLCSFSLSGFGFEWMLRNSAPGWLEFPVTALSVFAVWLGVTAWWGALFAPDSELFDGVFDEKE